MKLASSFSRVLSKVWFSLALLVLLLLALPGLLLLFLHWLSGEGPVNAWLQERAGLTYHISTPGWAALLLFLVPLAIVLLYFLKLKRKPLRVPSTFLWRKSIEDLHVNTFFQWLRENILLLLQVLTVLALIYAVLGLHVYGKTSGTKHYILLLDNSASMGATDVASSRLEQAKREAIREIDAHTDNDYGMIIVFNSSAEILQSYTNDRGLLRRTVETIGQTQRPTRFEEALTLAGSLANPQRGSDVPVGTTPSDVESVSGEGIPTEVHLFSDGRFPDVPDFALGNLNLQFHAQGQPDSDNLALVNLVVLRDEKNPQNLEVQAEVCNYRAQATAVQVQLEVFTHDSKGVPHLQAIYEEPALPRGQAVTASKDQPQDREINSQNSRLIPSMSTVTEKGEGGDKPPQREPGVGVARFFIRDLDDRSNAIIHAKILGVRDCFPLDDEVWLSKGVIRKARILIVGTGNQLLSFFFDQPATQRVADVTYLPPAALTDDAKYRRPAREGAYDLIIFDRCRPAKEEDMPLSNTFFIDELPLPWKKETMPQLTNPPVKGWMSKHPLMRYLVALYEIGIDQAFRFDLKDPRVPPRTPRLMESGQDIPLLFALNRQSFTDLVMAFALTTNKGEWNTNWPLQSSFPLFLRNLIYTLGNVSDAGAEENVQPGQVKVLHPDVPVREIEIFDPEGREWSLERGLRPDFSYGKTERIGVYRVRWNGAYQRSFAVNLFDADESNLEPRAEIRVGEARIAAGSNRYPPRPVWKWIALAALGLLLLEWYIYNRRVYI